MNVDRWTESNSNIEYLCDTLLNYVQSVLSICGLKMKRQSLNKTILSWFSVLRTTWDNEHKSVLVQFKPLLDFLLKENLY
jgi:hypothetical protein